METRIQFRVDEETKHLAQQMAGSQGALSAMHAASSLSCWLTVSYYLKGPDIHIMRALHQKQKFPAN